MNLPVRHLFAKLASGASQPNAGPLSKAKSMPKPEAVTATEAVAALLGDPPEAEPAEAL